MLGPKRVLTGLIVLALPMLTACPLKKDSATPAADTTDSTTDTGSGSDTSSNDTGAGGGTGGTGSGGGGTGGGGGAGGGGATLTTSDLYGTTWGWSNCAAGTLGSAGTATYFVRRLVFLNDNTRRFTFDTIWYSDSNCLNNTYKFGIRGHFAVGGLISGSSTIQSIAFTLDDYFDAFPYNNTETNFLNGMNGCSGGPFSTNTSSSLFGRTCGFMTDNFSNGSVVDNIFKITGGTTMSLGAMSNQVPGVLHGNTVPNTTTVNLTKH